VEYKLQQNEVTVPKNTGVEGFIHTLRALLKLKRLQSIHIDAKGSIKYERYIEDGESAGPIGVDYEGLEPWHIIRNGEVEELVTELTHPLCVVAYMFDVLAADKLFPTAFVTGADSILRQWIEVGTSGRTILKRTTSLMGLPVYTDRKCPDTVLILCGAYAREAALVDTQKSFKVEMDVVFTPSTQVEII